MDLDWLVAVLGRATTTCLESRICMSMLVSVCFDPTASVWKKGFGSVYSAKLLVPIELANGREPRMNGDDSADRLENLEPTLSATDVT